MLFTGPPDYESNDRSTSDMRLVKTTRSGRKSSKRMIDLHRAYSKSTGPAVRLGKRGYDVSQAVL